MPDILYGPDGNPYRTSKWNEDDTHRAKHATGGGDPLLPADIGAAPVSSSNVPGTIAYGGAGSGGTVLNPSRRDHVHPLLKPKVTDIDATGTPDGTTALHGDGTWKAPAGGSGGSGLVVMRKTAAQVFDTLKIFPADVVDLGFAVAANKTYVFSWFVVVTAISGTSPTFSWGLTGPASPVAVAWTFRHPTSTSLDVGLVTTAYGNDSLRTAVSSVVHLHQGVIVNGPNAGTVQLRVNAVGGTTPSVTIGAGSNGYALVQ